MSVPDIVKDMKDVWEIRIYHSVLNHVPCAPVCSCRWNILALKPLDTFGTLNKIKVHRFTNNLQGLQKVVVKDISWSIIPWNALLFLENIKTTSILDIENYGFILNTCHDQAKRAETRVGFPVIFSRLRLPIEPKFSQVCYFIYKLWYTECGPLTILFTESVQWL